MVHSMTAFAREETTQDWGTAVWEVRSVNSRYLDINLRLPEELRSLEPTAREQIAKKVNRGKLDCTLRFQSSVDISSDLNVNHDLVARLAAAGEKIRALLGDGPSLRTMDVLRWPGVIETTPPDVDVILQSVLALLNTSIENLITMRAREGAKILTLLEGRCAEVQVITAKVRELLPSIQESMRTRLTERLTEVIEQLDPQRLEQEMVLFANKMDVSEELDRLDAHTTEVGSALKEKKPVGRRLDFLMQELNREANTLGSKSVDTRTTRASVDLKVLIEQMREQIQNVE